MRFWKKLNVFPNHKPKLENKPALVLVLEMISQIMGIRKYSRNKARKPYVNPAFNRRLALRLEGLRVVAAMNVIPSPGGG